MKMKLLVIILFFIITIQLIFPTEHLQRYFYVIELLLLLFLMILMVNEEKVKNKDDVYHEKHERRKSLDFENKIVDILRIYRHDWQNHLQIIIGYLKLNKAEYITKYIEKLSKEEKSRSIISNFCDKELAAYLLMIPIHFPKMSIEVEAGEQLQSKISGIDTKLFLSAINSFLESFNQSIEENTHHHLIMSIVSDEEKIIVNFEFEGNINSVYEDIVSIGEHLRNKNGEFLIDLHNEEEFIMELSFPLKQNQQSLEVC